MSRLDDFKQPIFFIKYFENFGLDYPQNQIFID